MRDAFQPISFLSLAYVLIRLPLSFIYAAIVILGVGQGFQNLFNLIFVVLAGLAVWGVVMLERLIAKSWFGTRLMPLWAEPPPDRTWQQRVGDFLTSPVTWKTVAYVLIEIPIGFAVSVLALIGLLASVAAVIGPLIALVFYVSSSLLGFRVDMPAAAPPLLVATMIVGLALLVGALHAARWVAGAQVWLVTVMLGMSQTQLDLAEARADAAAERARAEVADRSRRDLVLNVSHELRNPLATMRAYEIVPA